MAARVTGTSRVLNKLEACIDCGNYYEAHQMYRTLYFRYQGQKRYAELKELLYNGAVKLLRLDQCNSGADLANLLVDVLVQSDTEPCDEQIERLGSLFALLAPHSPERSTFLARALQWSAGKEQPARGHPPAPPAGGAHPLEGEELPGGAAPLRPLDGRRWLRRHAHRVSDDQRLQLRD
ncbi:hypothetical protein MRX96_009458 [Rhipicephalus microplus]